MEKKGEKPMGKIMLVTGMLGNNSRGVPSFILNTAYMNAIVAAGGVPMMMAVSYTHLTLPTNREV